MGKCIASGLPVNFMGHSVFGVRRKNPDLPVDLLTHNTLKGFLHMVSRW